MDCCAKSYDDTFNSRRAEKEKNAYLAKGLKGNSRPLLELVKDLPLTNGSLIDVGGGIGMITFELMRLGIHKATLVDLSAHYLCTFMHMAEASKMTNKVVALKGDFVEVKDQLDSGDLVVMDKVICCYPNYRDLILGAASKSKKWIAYSLPANIWWVYLGQSLERAWKKFKGNNFRTFVHPTHEIENILYLEGFRKVKETRHWEWLYVLVERT